MTQDREAYNLPPDGSDDLNPDDPAVVRDVMEFAGCSAERAQEFLRKFQGTTRELDREG